MLVLATFPSILISPPSLKLSLLFISHIRRDGLSCPLYERVSGKIFSFSSKCLEAEILSFFIFTHCEARCSEQQPPRLPGTACAARAQISQVCRKAFLQAEVHLGFSHGQGVPGGPQNPCLSLSEFCINAAR